MAPPSEIFKALATKFDFDQKIAAQIEKVGATSLADFRYLANTPEEVVAIFVAPLEKEFANYRLQCARVKRAWAEVCAAESQKQAGTEERTLDEEHLLPAKDLATIKENFYTRYKMLLPPALQPSDRLLSKLQKALVKRNVEVIDVWSVRSLHTQRTNPAKRRRLGNTDIWVGPGPEEEGEDVERNWLRYLDQLNLLLTGLAMVGTTAMESLPTAPEILGTNSVEYVQVP